ncbi:MAG: hypothetical protein VB934_18810 [Polyangiaceae bacterium]
MLDPASYPASLIRDVVSKINGGVRDNWGVGIAQHFDAGGTREEGGTREGYTREGYTREGYTGEGYTREGYTGGIRRQRRGGKHMPTRRIL